MRGDKEAKCFDRIKKALFYLNEKPICNPFDGQSCFDVDTATFMENYLFYCNPDFKQNCFGLLESDWVEFTNTIRMAGANPSKSEFPDFIFDNGFIEHFQITSSRITRKGATHAREESEFKRRVDDDVEKLKKEWNETPSFSKVRSESWEFQNPVHSYEFLVESFKQNWENHIQSSKRYSKNKKIGIFMIEYPEIALAMCENVYCDWIDGMAQGDMRQQETFKEYRLSRDKELLKYIYGFKNVIKYVVYVNSIRCEVICTENIPYLQKLLPWEYIIYPMHVSTMSTLSNITIPVSFTEGNEKSVQI